MNKILTGLIFAILALPTFAAKDIKAHLTVQDSNSTFGICSKSLQNCTVQISQNRCLSPNGSVTITNTSRITANNIAASSSDANYINYVVQVNGCPASLAPGASCTISFYTRSFVAFTVSNVVVKGTNTSATSFNINATLCTLPRYLVTPGGDGRETFTPNSGQLVITGDTQSFTVTANAGYVLSSVVGGTCPVGGWAGNVYTTGAITSACNVLFSANPITYTVTPGNDGHVSSSPSTPQAVVFGGTQTFTVTPNTGYTVSNTVTGTCPTGSWVGNDYTTGPISANCTVIFNGTPIPYTVTPNNLGNVTINPPGPQTVNYGTTRSFTVTPDPSYTLVTTPGGTCPLGSWAGNVYTTGVITGNCSVDFSATLTPIVVTPSGDIHLTISPSTPQTVSSGDTQTFTVTPNSGYQVSTTVTGDCPIGSGSMVGPSYVYTTGTISTACSVVFSSYSTFAAAAGPDNVTATPGNGEAVVSWTPPVNEGGGSITGYTVRYYPTSNTNSIISGCTTSGLSCTVTGLANGTAYTFIVTTTTAIGGDSITGTATYSSSITPSATLSTSPATLAVNGTAYNGAPGNPRSMNVINNTGSSITILSVSAPSPALPGSASVVTTPSDCSTVGTVAAGDFCTITIDPGATPSYSSNCTTGIAPVPSVITVNTSAGSVGANVILLGLGCIYQGGYVFSIDDSTPDTGSVGGAVAATANWPNGLFWAASFGSVWGIDENSTYNAPSPNSSSTFPATLIQGQLNCNGLNILDGSCNTTNIITFYGAGTNYAAGYCAQPFDNTGTVCSGGANCYAGWNLPTACELSSAFSGSVGFVLCNQFAPPSATLGMYESLMTSPGQPLYNVFTSQYLWSSTEGAINPSATAWTINPVSTGVSFFAASKSTVSNINVICARSLTN